MLQLDKGYSRRKEHGGGGWGERGLFWNLMGRNKFETKTFPELGAEQLSEQGDLPVFNDWLLEVLEWSLLPDGSFNLPKISVRATTKEQFKFSLRQSYSNAQDL